MSNQQNPSTPGGNHLPEDPRNPGTSNPGSTPLPMDQHDRKGPGGTTPEERDNQSQAPERAKDAPPRHNL